MLAATPFLLEAEADLQVDFALVGAGATTAAGAASSGRPEASGKAAVDAEVG